MSDTTPTTHTQNVDLPELPDEFGKEVLARFAHKAPGDTSAASMTGDVPGGLPTDLAGQSEWGQGTSVDASAQFERMAQELARDIANGKVEGAATAGGGTTEKPAGGESLPPPAGAPAAEPAADATTTEGEAEGTLQAPTPGTQQPDPSTPATPPGGYVWDYVDPSTNAPASRRYDDAEVQQGLHLKAWADNLDPQLREAFAAIEDGQAVPIPRAEFDRYWAWQQQQQHQQRDADLSEIDDPKLAQLIQQQRDEIEQLRSQMGQPQQPAPYDNVNSNLDGFSQRFDQGVLAYMAQNQVTEPEARQLVQQAVQSGIVGHLTQQYSQWNPATGKLMAAADPAIVAREALNWAIFRNPQVHQTIVARKQPGASSPTPTTALTGQPTQAAPPAASNVTPITAKRARAASLATAPSAAVTPTPRSVTDMGSQELVNSMAAYIDSAQAQ